MDKKELISIAQNECKSKQVLVGRKEDQTLVLEETSSIDIMEWSRQDNSAVGHIN